MVYLFMKLSTQWNIIDSSGQKIGIRYETIKPTAKMLGIKMDEIKFDIFGELESEMIKIEAKERKND